MVKFAVKLKKRSVMAVRWSIGKDWITSLMVFILWSVLREKKWLV
jgi:hypothetical protein